MVISETTYQEKLSNFDLTNLKIAIKTYVNERLLGKLSLTVQDKENMFTNLPLYVIAGEDLLSGKWRDEISDDIKPYYNERNELTIDDGVILWGLRVIEQLRNKVLKELHQSHPGISRMKSLSRIHTWFPTVDHEIDNIVKSCQSCEKVSNEPNKSQPHTQHTPWIEYT